MTKIPQRLKLAAASAVVLLLVGCWANEDNKAQPPLPPAPVTEVPDSAGASSSAFVTFLLSLAGGDDTGEPLLIRDTFAVPADDSTEPIVLPG